VISLELFVFPVDSFALILVGSGNQFIRNFRDEALPKSTRFKESDLTTSPLPVVGVE
jgi:hypothetical protein